MPSFSRSAATFISLSVITLVAGAASQLACSKDPPPKACGDGTGSALTLCGSRKGQLKGLNVDADNGTIDWAAVKKSGITWAFASVSDGTTVDAQFAANWKGMKTAGVMRGATQYFRMSQDAQKQAELFVSTLKDSGAIALGDLSPVLDLETYTDAAGKVVANKDIIAAAKTWLTYVEEQTGRKPIIQVTRGELGRIGTDLKAYPLWIAEVVAYSKDCPDIPDTTKAWQWDFWTYSKRLTSPGITTDDQHPLYSVFFQGSAVDLKAFTGELSLEAGSADDGGSSTVDDDGGSSSGGGTDDDGGSSGGTVDDDAGSSSGGGGTDDAGSTSGGGSGGSGSSKDAGKSTSGSKSGSSGSSPSASDPKSERDAPAAPSDPCAPASPNEQDPSTK
jgi:lysozyme